MSSAPRWAWRRHPARRHRSARSSRPTSRPPWAAARSCARRSRPERGALAGTRAARPSMPWG
eukprot:2253644-Alexandrium_andersonii.AAC.1